MHILGLIIGFFFAISIWAWRINTARKGFGIAVNAAKAAANLPRQVSFRYKAGKKGLDLIKDPREAAVIIMMEIARARGGALTKVQTDVLENEIKHYFKFTPAECKEIIVHSVWVTENAPPPHETLRRLSQKIVNAGQIGPKDIVDLDAMLVAVSEAEGLPTRDQLALLQIYRDRVGLRT